MCGIFGLIAKKEIGLTQISFRQEADLLFKLSESRGGEAAGAALRNDNKIFICKGPFGASDFIKTRTYRNLFKLHSDSPLMILGHTRLVTNGAQGDNKNNQPIIKDSLVGIHNGIIVNEREIWEKFPELERKYEVDTEVFLSLTQWFLSQGNLLPESIKKAFESVRGTVSIAILSSDAPYLALATNNGSIYFLSDKKQNLFIFASEFKILRDFIKESDIKKTLSFEEIKQIKAGNGYLVDLETLEAIDFSLEKAPSAEKRDVIPLTKTNVAKIFDFVDCSDNIKSVPSETDGRLSLLFDSKKIEKWYLANAELIKKLKRCSVCLLPETMPFIEFDDQGVCSYCNNHHHFKIEGEKSLVELTNKYKKNGSVDCLVTFSGGRDSCFSLHYLKKVLGMNPIAYSYDWGMLTDLARRNQARLCGKLGIEHILISADIKKKREYIKKNILAWLKRPDLGTVPLFMAGDKQYFYYANKLKKQMDVELIILGVNPYERTDFKTGFCGVKPLVGEQAQYRLPMISNLTLAFYYARQYFYNYHYFNSSLLDTIWAYASYYLIKHDYLNLYQYIRWDEKEIADLLIGEYDWEIASDTKSTWRIGDGTAPFYNYIYWTVAGFTENDTFRSNQIREGVLNRKQALDLIEEENRPRVESLKWYTEQVGFNLEEALKIINLMPKLYKIN